MTNYLRFTFFLYLSQMRESHQLAPPQAKLKRNRL